MSKQAETNETADAGQNCGKLYQLISQIVEARLNCIKSGNPWADKHEKTLERLNDLLPSGSGIDCGTKINVEDSTPDKLVFHFDYHYMNDGGFYDGWTAHTLYVTPSLSSGIHLRITGSNRNQVKDYLHEVYDTALREETAFDRETQSYFVPAWREAAKQLAASNAA